MYNVAGYIFMNGIFLYFKQVLRFTVSDPIVPVLRTGTSIYKEIFAML